MNASTHYLVLKSYAGETLALIDDYHRLNYTRRVNEPGICQFELRADHSAVANVADKCQLLVYRRNQQMDVDWYNDWGGLVRSLRRSYTDHDMLQVTGYGWLHMLSWRIVAYYKAYLNRSKFVQTKAETIMKRLMNWNAAVGATTANGRDRDGVIPGITVQTNTNLGNTLDWECARANLLTTLQDIARVGGGDFDLVRTGDQAWQFRWYTGQLGTDRSVAVTFSLANGNMANPVYTWDRSREITVAIVGGRGEEAARATVVRTGANYSASNDSEGFVNAFQSTTTAAYETEGDRQLSEWQARQEFEFEILQTPACFYGKHYFLGDLCSAEYAGTTATVKIVGVNIQAHDGGGETIQIETQNV